MVVLGQSHALRAFTLVIFITATPRSKRLVEADRLTLNNQTFTYNPDDSIKTATDSNGNNAKTYSYNTFGDLSDDGFLCDGYDGFDRLTSTAPHSNGGNPCPGQTTQGTSYTYDGLDRQRSRTDNQNNSVTAYHYDGLSQAIAVESPSSADRIYELDAMGTPKAMSVSNTTSYLNADGQGDVTTVTNSSAQVTCTARFDPWGTPRSPRSSTNLCNSGSTSNDIFYRGARRDSATGNYQFGSRTYDPSKADFLTPDSYRNGDPGMDLSIGTDPVTENRYSYVNGNPVNLIDPNGHMVIGDGGGASTSTKKVKPGNTTSGNGTQPTPVYASTRSGPQRETFNGQPSQFFRFSVPPNPAAGGAHGGLFIAGERVIVPGPWFIGPDLRGNGRTFDPDANSTQYKVFFRVNYRSGQGFVRINPTCDAASNECKRPLSSNTVLIKNHDNSLTFTIGAKNSLITWAPAINATFVLSSGHNGAVKVPFIDRDDFPSFEVYQTDRGSTVPRARQSEGEPFELAPIGFKAMNPAWGKPNPSPEPFPSPPSYP